MKDNKLIYCELCGRYFSNRGIGPHTWRVHGEGINFDPNIGYKNGTRVAWNKGLTKETSSSVLKMSNSLKRKYSDVEKEVNDDGKLKRKYINKRVNAEHEHIDFSLTYEEFILLVKEAGLKSSQIGFSGENYVLGRYNDTGAYKIGNCRFITQKENSDEKNRRLYPNQYKDT